MGLFSSSKSSSTSSTEIIDQRQAATEGGINVGAGAYYTSTDQGALNAATNLAAMQTRLAETAILQSYGLSNNAIKALSDGFSDALDFGSDTVERSLKSVDDTIARTLDTIEKVQSDANINVTTANNSLRDIANEAIYKVESATRSDSAQSFNNMVKYAAIAIVAIVAIPRIKWS